MVDSVTRWYAEVNLFSQFISNAMRVSSVRLLSSAPAPWVLRNAELAADVTIDPTTPLAPLSPHPVMNRNWVFFSKNAATGATPTIDIFFIMEC